MKTIICTHSNLLTSEQAVIVYQFADMTKDKLPKKGNKTLLVPTGKVFYSITWMPQKSTYGKRLYLCEHLQWTENESRP